jgi:hypothetical protein
LCSLQQVLPTSIAILVKAPDNVNANLSEPEDVLMKIFGVFCACVAIAFPTTSWAAKFMLDAQVVEAFSADGLFTPIPLPDYSQPVGYPAVYKIDYSIVANTAEFAPTDVGFAAVVFSIDQSQGVSDAFGLGWQPNNPTIDLNGSFPGGETPIFWSNGDIGPSATDLHAVIASVAPPSLIPSVSDPRLHLGEVAPQKIGSTYLLWDGVTPSVSEVGISHWTRVKGTIVHSYSRGSLI